MSESPSEMDLELYRLVENSPRGSCRMFTADKSGVQDYIQQHFKNHDDIKNKIRNAINSNCFIELISLRLQIIDYWLRIFLENSTPEIKRDREFGRLIKQAKNAGLPQQIYNKLEDFNNTRIAAIHGFAIGTTSYEQIQRAAESSKSLLIETITHIANNSGEVVYSRDHLHANPGAMVMEVAGFCRNLAENCEY